MKISKESKVHILSFILWAINVKVFLMISNWSQIAQIWKYSNSLVDFYKSIFEFYYDFVRTIPSITLILTILFAVLLYIFWLYYFKVYFHKLEKAKVADTTIFGIFSSIFTFLGFGCVACGQTLLSSILFLFVSNGTMFLADFVGNFVIILGLIILSYGIYKNYKIYHNKNICRI